MDAVDTGIGQLVDADMNEEIDPPPGAAGWSCSAVQALSIANQSAQMILPPPSSKRSGLYTPRST